MGRNLQVAESMLGPHTPQFGLVGSCIEVQARRRWPVRWPTIYQGIYHRLTIGVQVLYVDIQPGTQGQRGFINGQKAVFTVHQTLVLNEIFC